METDVLSGVWPEWEVVRSLGSGSFGDVYEVARRDFLGESRAAVKVISIPRNKSEVESLRSEGMSVSDSKTFLENIVKDLAGEIQLMESFKGTQNIVSIEDYKAVEKTGEIGWNIYIRMELLTPFNDYISDRILPEEEVVRLGVDICTALELCAQRKVIHRDIKPENIFVNSFGAFKLGDFGIARKLENVTGGLSQKGTFNYMAPEIARGSAYDATVDLYSLGLVLYRLMNQNRLPFLETKQQALSPTARTEALRRRLSGEPLPAPCDASLDMARAILCACDPDPANRFTTATAMKNALLSIGASPDVYPVEPSGPAAGGPGELYPEPSSPAEMYPEADLSVPAPFAESPAAADLFRPAESSEEIWRRPQDLLRPADPLGGEPLSPPPVIPPEPPLAGPPEFTAPKKPLAADDGAGDHPGEKAAADREPAARGVPGKGHALASLILGITSLVFCMVYGTSILSGILGIVMANKANAAGFVGGQSKAGKIMSIIGIILGALILIGLLGQML